MPKIPHELSYVALLFALFVVPRLLQRFRLPAAITSLALGAVAGMGLGLFDGDSTLKMLSTFGIVSLFLFAGLDVDFAELRGQAAVLSQHVVIMIVTIAIIMAAAYWWLELDLRSATLLSLALLTPSTGFILDSLDQLKLDAQSRFWVKSKAISAELVCLGILFATIRSTSTSSLAIASLTLLGLVVLLPLVFRLFAAFVVPYAPKSEFAFLMMTAVACGAVTYQLGVYYLVGAFVVGIAAQRLRRTMSAIASERMLHSVESFASLFVPFYFFVAGTHLKAENFAPAALLAGLGFVLIAVPLRIITLWLHRRQALGESFHASLLVGAPILPTLVFTLVIAEILRDKFQAPPWLLGGLMVYAVVSCVVRGVLVGVRSPVVTVGLLGRKRRSL
jgi:Kef-type K+ transport system membrane component KefB